MPKETFYHLPEEKRASVERAAIEEFAEHGFEAASISHIVAQAGIAKGSFYQYFSDKHDLFMHLVDLSAREKAAFFQGQRPPDPNLDLFAYLRWMFQAGARYDALRSRLSQAVSRVLFGEGLFMGEAFKDARQASARMFADWVAQAAARGEIDPTVDPAVAAYVIETLMNSLGLFILSQQQVNRDELRQGQLDWLVSDRAQQISEDVLRVIEHGLRAPARSLKE
jgi:AcrR family transcriptional regulator